MKRVIGALAVSSLLAGGSIGALAVGSSASSSSATKTRADSTLLTPRCPAGTRVLPADAVALAAEQALREVPRLYPGEGPAIVTRSERAPYAGVLGSEVAHKCGSRIFKRTVVVELLLTKELPSASLSEGAVFVSRVAAGYRVWEIAH